MPTLRSKAWPFAALLLASCATTIDVERDEFPHSFAIGKTGRSGIGEVGGETLEDPDFERQVAVAEEALELALSEKPGRRVLLYIHGGLVGKHAGYENVQRFLCDLREDEEYGEYPIFLNWDSSRTSSWTSGLFSTVQGRTNRIGGLLTSPFRLVAALGRAFTRLPYTLVWQGAKNGAEVVRGIPVLEVPDHWEGQVLRAHGEPQPSFASRFVLPVVPGALRIVTTPLADTWGVTAYRDMRRTAHQAMLRDAPSMLDAELRPRAPDGLEAGALELLAQMLLSMIARGEDFRITVAAHSMGAHIANELLARYPELPVDKVLFMSPACSFREFSSTTLEFVRHTVEDDARPNCKFYCLTLHPHREQTEKALGGVPPHGSLLVYIDDYITDHHSVTDLTLGAWNNVMRALPTLRFHRCDARCAVDCKKREVRELLHFRMFEWDSHATGHGQIDNCRIWRPEEYWQATDSADCENHAHRLDGPWHDSSR